MARVINIGAEDSVYATVKRITALYSTSHRNIKLRVHEIDIPRLQYMKNKPDIIVSEDTYILKDLLNKHVFTIVHWYVNPIVLVYNPKKVEFSCNSWMQTLQHIKYGYSDPKTDPLGYYAYFIFDMYNIIHHTNIRPHTAYVRDETTDLIWLYKVNKLDAVFTYKSFAEEAHLPYFELPEPYNLAIKPTINTSRIKFVRNKNHVINFHISTVGIAYKNDNYVIDLVNYMLTHAPKF